MMEFLAMGGYAWYVWMSYAAVAFIVVVESLAVRARQRRAIGRARTAGVAQPAPVPRFGPAPGDSAAADPARGT